MVGAVRRSRSFGRARRGRGVTRLWIRTPHSDSSAASSRGSALGMLSSASAAWTTLFRPGGESAAASVLGDDAAAVATLQAAGLDSMLVAVRRAAQRKAIEEDLVPRICDIVQRAHDDSEVDRLSGVAALAEAVEVASNGVNRLPTEDRADSLAHLRARLRQRAVFVRGTRLWEVGWIGD